MYIFQVYHPNNKILKYTGALNESLQTPKFLIRVCDLYLDLVNEISRKYNLISLQRTVFFCFPKEYSPFIAPANLSHSFLFYLVFSTRKRNSTVLIRIDWKYTQKIQTCSSHCIIPILNKEFEKKLSSSCQK